MGVGVSAVGSGVDPRLGASVPAPWVHVNGGCSLLVALLALALLEEADQAADEEEHG